MTEGPQPEQGHELSVSPRCRVIVDNDYQGDPDGLVALAHHLLSPANHVAAVTSSLLNPRFPNASPRAQDGAALARELLEVLGGIPRPPVHAGSEQTFGDQSTSAASTAIVNEARKDDHPPLYLACGGPLTNVASALCDASDIASRLTLIWIGGSLDSSAFEYNRDTDKAAATFVFDQQELEIHQFPLETYRRCTYSVAELEHDLSNSGLLGRWLWSRFTYPPDWVRIGGVWPLGDSPTSSRGSTPPSQANDSWSSRPWTLLVEGSVHPAPSQGAKVALATARFRTTVKRLGNASARPPQKSHKSGLRRRSPQVSHRQNGIPRHTSAHLLRWPVSP